jgi:hypothetical protein
MTSHSDPRDDASADDVSDSLTPTGAVPGLDIYNFEHNFSSPIAVRFGPYILRVSNEAQARKDIFRRSEVHTFASAPAENGELEHTVTLQSATAGNWMVTARVDDHPALYDASVLFPDMPFMTGSDDLSLVLWFLTGREVAIGTNKQPRMMLCEADRLVSPNYFYSAEINWASLNTLSSLDASDALYSICLALAAPDLLLKTSLGTGALDVLVSKWHKSSKRNRYNDAVIERCKLATEAFKQSLVEQGENAATIDDVAKRIAGLMYDSAVSKLQAFLVHLRMLPSDANEEAIGRVRLLNKHRNAIAHKAAILINPTKSIQIELQVAGAVSAIVLKICRVYIAKHLLEVNDTYGVDKDETYIREFFVTGKLHGQDVFHESYDDFIAGLKSEWREQGQLLD